MHLSCDRLAERGIEPSSDDSTEVRSLLQHKDNEAHVDEGEHNVHPVNSLSPFAHAVLGVGLEVTERDQEYNNRVDASPDVSRDYIVSLSGIGRSVLQVASVTPKSSSPDISETQEEHCLDMVVNVRNKRLHFPFRNTGERASTSFN
jgi:hypothetical protein